jgi:hypothetical protein
MLNNEIITLHMIFFNYKKPQLNGSYILLKGQNLTLFSKDLSKWNLLLFIEIFMPYKHVLKIFS